MSGSVILFVFSLLVCGCVVECGIQCLNANGAAVDWWAIYKQPKSFSYVYADNKNNALTQMSDQLNETNNNPITKTLNQITKNGVGYVIYNDQPADGTSKDSYGHLKGIMGFDSTQTSFWITHSLPRFPASSSNFAFPSSGNDNGQTFFCVSLDFSKLNVVFEAMRYDKPFILSSQSLSFLPSSLSNFRPLLSGAWISTPSSFIKSISTLGGSSMKLYAKNAKFGDDLWSKLVALNLKDNMKVQTWRNGSGGKLSSYCVTQNGYDVENISQLSIGNNTWSYTSDHSKWGVTSSQYYTCFGDINRVQSQYKRGGGAICYSKKGLWSSMTSTIANVESC